MSRLLAFIAVLSCLLPAVVQAEELTIRPFLIEETLTARDVVARDITLHNGFTNKKLNVYATVNAITMDDVGEIQEFKSPVMTDRTDNATSWIEITRGRISIMPDETVTVPLIIRTHPEAVPGTYYVFLGFVATQKRDIAEATALRGDANGVIVKITIADKREETLRLQKFSIDRIVFGKSSRTATIELQNLGDLPTEPKGEVIFYNSSGEEVGSSIVSTDGNPIAVGSTAALSVPVPLASSIGRFKANVSLEYGSKQTASLYDSTTFYLMPPYILLLLFVGVLIVSLLLVFSLRRAFGERYEDDDDSVALYVREGHDPNPQDHDIDLKNK
ncbi:hypothetical protein KC945_02905 [Candidatus Saccharibacteria bacterium]|nr:hypothetical protein [Candidatus Saccharibacteria bacterium]MCA9366643.1 hypothetical protein [Candidatus Kaiserbacteria bacterium]